MQDLREKVKKAKAMTSKKPSWDDLDLFTAETNLNHWKDHKSKQNNRWQARTEKIYKGDSSHGGRGGSIAAGAAKAHEDNQDESAQVEESEKKIAQLRNQLRSMENAILKRRSAREIQETEADMRLKKGQLGLDGNCAEADETCFWCVIFDTS